MEYIHFLSITLSFSLPQLFRNTNLGKRGAGGRASKWVWAAHRVWVCCCVRGLRRDLEMRERGSLPWSALPLPSKSLEKPRKTLKKKAQERKEPHDSADHTMPWKGLWAASLVPDWNVPPLLSHLKHTMPLCFLGGSWPYVDELKGQAWRFLCWEAP